MIVSSAALTEGEPALLVDPFSKSPFNKLAIASYRCHIRLSKLGRKKYCPGYQT